MSGLRATSSANLDDVGDLDLDLDVRPSAAGPPR